MSYPIQTIFLNMQRSEAIENVVQGYAEKLARFYSRIQAVRVVVEMPHKKHHSGNTYQIKFEIAVPGQTLCIETNADSRLEYRDVKIALRDAFLLSKRRLEDFAAQRTDHHSVAKQSEKSKFVTDLLPHQSASTDVYLTEY